MHPSRLLPLVSAAAAVVPGHFISPSSPLSKRQGCPNVLSPSYQSPVVGSGWVAQIIAQDLSSPRSIVFDSEGGMLVLEQKKGITRLRFSPIGEDEGDSTTCLAEDSRQSVVADEELLHGLALSSDGATLYASTSDKVYAWGYDAASGAVSGDPKTLIQDMDSGGHVTRTILLLGGDNEGAMLVSRGSDGNLDTDTREVESGKSQIRSFSLETLDSARDGTAYTEGAVLGWGLRNSVGMAEDPITHGIWSVENSADQMQRLGEDIHADNPGEELNFHGYLNGSETEGANFGYPDCFALWGTESFPQQGDLMVGSQFANEGSEKTDQQCGEGVTSPRLTFQSHVAPLDVLVMGEDPVVGESTGENDTRTERDMYITFHGSWNREDPVGYTLVSVALEYGTGQPIAQSDSKNASRLIMSNADLSKCPDECFRPVGLAVDANMRLFMTSDATGEIYVLKKADFSIGTLSGGDGGGDDSDEADGDSAAFAFQATDISVVALCISSLATAILAGSIKW